MTAPEATLSLRPVGIVRATQCLHHEAPRQSGLGRGADGVIEIRQGLQQGLRDLAGFSHLWVLAWLHLARGRRCLVMPPRDRQLRGVFATRAPQRPNAIGLSCVRLVRIDKRRVFIADHDLLDGTPVLDLKPYLPYCDSVPDAAIGYVAGLPADGADHRQWWHDKGMPPPKRYRERVRATRPPAVSCDSRR